MWVLLIEDDVETRRYIARGLGELGHRVDAASDGASGLLLATSRVHEVIVIDRMLPRLGGMEVLATLRNASMATPVLILTALGDADARVEGLEAGADDYLAKPFVFAELVARLTALARRPPLRGVAPTRLVVADLELDLLRHSVRRGGASIGLKPREFRLLAYLMRHVGCVVTRTMLLEQVWDYHFDPKTSVVETHISRLRAKIDRGFGIPLLHTVRGAGYCIKAPE